MISVRFGPQLAAPQAGIDDLVENRFASRLFSQDATLWGAEAESEAAQRLGWIDVFDAADDLVRRAVAVREELHSTGIDRVVLSGMGGSSLAPEVIARRDDVQLTILDSTHPSRVRAALESLERTALVVSSKSGSTVETRSHLASFEAAFREHGIPAETRIIVVTDPGSALEQHARERGYRVFSADPDVGGRYSALTAFGLVPSVLAGADAMRHVAEGRASLAELRSDRRENPALRLAALLHAQLPERYLFGASEAADPPCGLPDWIEQLVAESSGKHGLGMLPIALPADAPEVHEAARGELPSTQFLVSLREESDLSDAPDPGDLEIAVSAPLGAQFLLWEVATAALCRLIGINPFDQPDVESAKAAARAALSEPSSPHEDSPSSRDTLVERLRQRVSHDSYIAIQAYVPAGADTQLEALRRELHDALRIPVSVGYGPRYLHSTGQFHKGGPQRGAFVQVVDGQAVDDLAIPGLGQRYAELLDAQARGDRHVLRENGASVVIIDRSQL